MIRAIKKIFFTFSVTVIVLVLFGAYYIKCSPRAQRAEKNINNTRKIRIGESEEELILTMGHPKRRYPGYYGNKESVLYYEAPFFASDGIEIYLDTTQHVSRIVFPKGY